MSWAATTTTSEHPPPSRTVSQLPSFLYLSFFSEFQCFSLCQLRSQSPALRSVSVTSQLSLLVPEATTHLPLLLLHSFLDPTGSWAPWAPLHLSEFPLSEGQLLLSFHILFSTSPPHSFCPPFGLGFPFFPLAFPDWEPITVPSYLPCSRFVTLRSPTLYHSISRSLASNTFP